MTGAAVPRTGAAAKAARTRTRRPGAGGNAAGRSPAGPGLAGGTSAMCRLRRVDAVERIPSDPSPTAPSRNAIKKGRRNDPRRP